MNAARTIRGDRLHIAVFGRMNAGKSSLINAITDQPVAIVSEVPGTTTDPVYKAMELLPLGPVVLVDTAGLDDESGDLGIQRRDKALRVLAKTDLALLVVDALVSDLTFERAWLERLRQRSVPTITVINKIDIGIGDAVKELMGETAVVRVSARTKAGIAELKDRIQELAPREWEPPFIRDLILPGEVVVLVTPIDLGAPKGRLIMPQVKALRDILDADAMPIMCKERELPVTLSALKRPPALVITDSQVFPQVAADVPDEVPLTSFSILSARQKGDLMTLVDGARAISGLRPGDRVLIAESCSHHPLEDDIGRVKIPRWLEHFVGGELRIETVPGSAFPDDLDEYKLVVHCGGCTLNRREMLGRMEQAASRGVPITNYGVLIAYVKNVFPRALSPFPDLYDLYKSPVRKVDMRLRRFLAERSEI
jgi:[FeFe] hydrogenase H-cluster maturation GTPase HydF